MLLTMILDNFKELSMYLYIFSFPNNENLQSHLKGKIYGLVLRIVKLSGFETLERGCYSKKRKRDMQQKNLLW